MIQEQNKSTVLKKLNPGAKLIFATGLVLALLFFQNLYLSLGVLLTSFVLIVIEKQTTLFKFILWTMLVLFVVMFGIYGAMAPPIDYVNDPVLFNILGIRYYQAGINYAAVYYFRVAPMMSSLFLIFASIDVTDLSVTMCNMGIPYKFVFTFIDSFQLIILLNKDMEQITDAQRARGLSTEGNLIQRFKAFIPIIVPVVANSIIKVQDQAIAMDTKGFNSETQKTVYRELAPYKGDKYMIAAGILLGVSGIAYLILVSMSIITPFITNIG